MGFFFALIIIVIIAAPFFALPSLDLAVAFLPSTVYVVLVWTKNRETMRDKTVNLTDQVDFQMVGMCLCVD